MALIAPAFKFDREELERGRSRLESHYGLRTILLDSVHERHQYFAGSDERREEELAHWLADPKVRGIFAIRGGYGCSRIYPGLIQKLKKSKLKKSPKILLGYSDLTILLNGFFQDLGWTGFHGPVVTSKLFARHNPNENPRPAIEEETFQKALFTDEPLGTITDPEVTTLFPGKGRGRIVGGCLSLAVASLGTSYEIDTSQRVLFLEDVTEKPYRLDRMLVQLIHAGKLSKIRGLVFGQMTDCGPPADVLSSLQMALEMGMKQKLVAKVPVIFNFPAGHGTTQITFPIGAQVEVEATKSTRHVKFLEAGAE